MSATTMARRCEACEADAIVAYVPEADKNNRLAKQGRFTLKEFVYDAGRGCLPLPGRRRTAADEGS